MKGRGRRPRDLKIEGGASWIGRDASQRGESVMSAGSTFGVNAAGRRRSPATMPGYLAGRAPRNKGMQYPPDPPRAEEIVLMMRQAGHDRHWLRVRALIAVLWRGGLRISEALALNETDIDERRGSLLIRHGKGAIRSTTALCCAGNYVARCCGCAVLGSDRACRLNIFRAVRGSRGMRVAGRVAGSGRASCSAVRCGPARVV